MSDPARARERVERLVRAAGVLASADTELGRRARRDLVASTRLSAAGVELALTECLEIAPSAAEITELIASVEPRRRTLVLLPANVFVAAHRAIALGLAASERVLVRPSRREPELARLLLAADPGLFELVSELRPEAGDALWAYGGATTLEALAERLPAGVDFHAHGPGFGVAVLDAASATPETARALVSDIVPFDQRGCLSPRVALVLGDAALGEHFAALVARELDEMATRVPRGTLSESESAAITRFRDAAAYAGTRLAAGPGWVALGSDGRLAPAPDGRNLWVLAGSDPVSLLAPIRTELTALGVAAGRAVEAALAAAFPAARRSPMGRMQRPRFDGPADLRPARPG